MKNLLPSKKQHALLEFIDGFIKEHDYAPSYREIARALDYKSVSTVATHINGLIERGWLIKRDNAKRSVEVVYQSALGMEGQAAAAQNSTAPSLPVAPEDWLRDRINQVLATSESHDIEMVRQALEILGLAELMPPLEVLSSQ